MSRFPTSDRRLLAALLSLDDLARAHGAGGLAPALAAAIASDLRFAPRVAAAGQPVAADLPAHVVRLDDHRPAGAGQEAWA